jgi:hypothetical protein
MGLMVRQAKLARSTRWKSGPGNAVAGGPGASVARASVAVSVKRTQQSSGVCIEPRNPQNRGGRGGHKRRRQHVRYRHTRCRRSAVVGDHITLEMNVPEPGISRAWLEQHLLRPVRIGKARSRSR